MASHEVHAWHPIHDNHAIEVMAVVLAFAQPLPELLLKKVLRTSEDSASAAGLKSAKAIDGWQVSIDTAGVPQTNKVVQGQSFSAVFEPLEGTTISNRVAEQLQVDRNAIVYRTWRYVSWSWQSERLQTLITSALEIARNAVALASLRLEYLDRFRFEGDATAADPRQLLRVDSPLIAPHIFSAPDLWHCHTGAFLTASNRTKRLQQVMIDALDEPFSQQKVSPVRWVNITTSLEDRFTLPQPDEQEIDPAMIFQTLTTMHASLKELLASIITNALAKRIYLRD
jgi:uncharacterized protein (TIGR04255 family)